MQIDLLKLKLYPKCYVFAQNIRLVYSHLPSPIFWETCTMTQNVFLYVYSVLVSCSNDKHWGRDECWLDNRVALKFPSMANHLFLEKKNICSQCLKALIFYFPFSFFYSWLSFNILSFFSCNTLIFWTFILKLFLIISSFESILS